MNNLGEVVNFFSAAHRPITFTDELVLYFALTPNKVEMTLVKTFKGKRECNLMADRSSYLYYLLEWNYRTFASLQLNI